MQCNIYKRLFPAFYLEYLSFLHYFFYNVNKHKEKESQRLFLPVCLIYLYFMI